MEVVELKITNPHDREAVAKQVADAIANAIAGAEKKQEETRKEWKSDVDNMDAEEVEAVTMSEEFKAFNDELGKKIADLNEFIENNRKSWNCAAVVAITAIKGRTIAGGGVTVVGRGDAVGAACERIVKHDGLIEMITHIQKKREALAYLELWRAQKSPKRPTARKPTPTKPRPKNQKTNLNTIQP